MMILQDKDISMNARNLAEWPGRQAERLGSRPALRWKQDGLWRELSWAEYHEAVQACAAALLDVGVRPGDRVGLLAENRIEWILADMAIMSVAAINVPPHAPLTARQIHFQLSDAGVSWLFVSGTLQLDKIRQVISELPGLRGLVVFDASAVCACGDRPVMSWRGFLQRGRARLKELSSELRRREALLGSDDLATIMYTSGTTGHPKGVMLTHGNLVSNSIASLAVAPWHPDDVILCWLPLSHIYARTVDHYQKLLAGLTLSLSASPETVVADLAEVEPMQMSSVPRFYEKVLAAVMSPSQEETNRRLRRVFGRRMRWLGSGGAPLPLSVAQAYHAAGLRILPGYGLTESSPVISFNRAEGARLDTVGPPLPGIEIAIAADGEVLSRGPHIMKGYWNNPQATAEAIRDGWLYTGDLGQIDADGHLRITGRKKELMVLSSGKKVVPAHIEGLLLADPCIDQVVVHGEGRNFLTALIVPHWDNLRSALGRQGEPEELARDEQVCELLLQRAQAVLAEVSPWERVKKILVLARPFTVAAEELTVSLKLRRGVVLTKYADQLERLYQD
jgi:long-chain acyl-CoA synthetase